MIERIKTAYKVLIAKPKLPQSITEPRIFFGLYDSTLVFVYARHYSTDRLYKMDERIEVNNISDQYPYYVLGIEILFNKIKVFTAVAKGPSCHKKESYSFTYKWESDVPENIRSFIRKEVLLFVDSVEKEMIMEERIEEQEKTECERLKKLERAKLLKL